jgi:hypothetical protein
MEMLNGDKIAFDRKVLVCIYRGKLSVSPGGRKGQDSSTTAIESFVFTFNAVIEMTTFSLPVIGPT